MACSLTKAGSKFKAVTGANVTVKVIASATNLVSANYKGTSTPVTNNGVSFTVADGSGLLLLDLAGPQDDVEIVEDCGGGKIQRLFAYSGDFHPVVGFTIVGHKA